MSDLASQAHPIWTMSSRNRPHDIANHRRRFLKQVAGTVATSILPPQCASGSRPDAKVRLIVEAEDDIYTFAAANNGADPMWCYGSTCLVRIDDQVFASGLETIREAAPLNNCRWKIFRRSGSGWQLWFTDEVGRTREPAPIVGFPNGPLYLSANPTLGNGAEPRGGPARPEIFEFHPSQDPLQYKRHTPKWSGTPRFTEHSYRSFAADGASRHLVIIQNIGYSHAEWTFRDEAGHWSAQGRLEWPWGADYETPQSIRVCYANVALTNRAVHFCGVSDIVEPNKRWREFKRQLTGQRWDYDLRRLFYTWCPSIGSAGFYPWIEIASCEEFGGRITPADIWVSPDGAVHVLWIERAIDTRLRPRFFPKAKQRFSLRYAVVKEGRLITKKTLVEGGEESSADLPSAGRFHIMAPDRLFVISHVANSGVSGKAISENRLVEMRNGEFAGPPQVIPLRNPFIRFFTTTPRAGSVPSPLLEIMGQRLASKNTIGYAKIRLE
jgi:hypothetical protein